MKNLLGRSNRIKVTREELDSLCLRIVENENPIIPPFGMIGSFEFHRGPDHWIVNGMIPLVTAEKLYNDSLGYATILVASNEQRPSPSEKRKNELIVRGKLIAGKGTYLWAVQDPHLGWCIPSYKIISFQAAQLFIATIKEDRLVKIKKGK